MLSLAPTPMLGRDLSLPQIVAALRRGGRQRNIETQAKQIHAALRAEELQAAVVLSEAYGTVARSALRLVAAYNDEIAALAVALSVHFEQHPDAELIRSLPGLGMVLGARALGEFGDDPNRYANAKSRKNYAGTSPITIASGKKSAVLARHVRNRRLYDAIDQWAFCTLTNSPGCRAYYDERRKAGDMHHQALRALGNRLVGILHGCLKHRTLYDEHTAWAHRSNKEAA